MFERLLSREAARICRRGGGGHNGSDLRSSAADAVHLDPTERLDNVEGSIEETGSKLDDATDPYGREE